MARREQGVTMQPQQGVTMQPPNTLSGPNRAPVGAQESPPADLYFACILQVGLGQDLVLRATYHVSGPPCRIPRGRRSRRRRPTPRRPAESAGPPRPCCLATNCWPSLPISPDQESFQRFLCRLLAIVQRIFGSLRLGGEIDFCAPRVFRGLLEPTECILVASRFRRHPLAGWPLAETLSSSRG
jgi:hypothetical protein